MQPSIPPRVNKLIQDNHGELSTFPFPPNIAATIPRELRKKIIAWMVTNYIFPQITARQQWEDKWDHTLDMARAALKIQNMKVPEKDPLEARYIQMRKEGNASPQGIAEISDTLMFETLDRLYGLNHYIRWKTGLPVKFCLPENKEYPEETELYNPSYRLQKSANCLLKFCADGADYYRNDAIAIKQYYTYGVTYASSEFEQQIGEVMRRSPENPKEFAPVPELLKFGVSFQPVSLRKLWLNTQLTAYNMKHQPCPFFFEEIPRFAIVAKPYSADLDPFGYVNLHALGQGQWLYNAAEMQSYLNALKQPNAQASFPNIGEPKYNVETKWVLYPMLPLGLVELTQEEAWKPYEDEPQVKQFQEQQGQMWAFDEDGSLGLPFLRYIMETFGVSLISGECEMIRLQRNFYPMDDLPLYGSNHMPDLDSGQYSPSICDILECHYTQMTRALNQYLLNKDRINNPPAKVLHTSPATEVDDLNQPGAKNFVNGMNDYAHDDVIDGTQTTPMFMGMIREQAKTAGKGGMNVVTGQPMGSRTTASEATTAFETSMSSITTDANMYNNDMGGGYATRVKDYLALWADPDVLAAISGSYGFAIKPEHLQGLSIIADSGTSYIESLNRRHDIREILQSSIGDPSINRPYLWRALLKELRFPDVNKIVNDGGMEQQILEAANQAERTYLGELVMIDPDQNHQIAKSVKTSYLKDSNSVWNSDPKFARNAKLLVDQIMLHQQYIMLQYYQQLLAANANSLDPEGAPDPAAALQQLQSGAGGNLSLQPGGITGPMYVPGQAAQRTGGTL